MGKMGEQQKWPRKNTLWERERGKGKGEREKGKGERGKGKGENVGAGKVGKLNDHHTKRPYIALKTKWETWGKCAKQGKEEKSQRTAS